jgi:hypothetical protein
LTCITVNAGNTVYKSIDGVLYNKEGTILIAYPAGKTATSFTIPNGVTTIGDSAFAFCTGLTSITIPSGVTSIGDSAFSYCTELTSITIPSGITSIGLWAFRGCTELTTINFCGASEEWNAITKGVDWNQNCPASITYNYAG